MTVPSISMASFFGKLRVFLADGTIRPTANLPSGEPEPPPDGGGNHSIGARCETVHDLRRSVRMLRRDGAAERAGAGRAGSGDGRGVDVRVLVTGAAGFIGSHLAARLVREGHEVVGFDDLSEGRRENLDRAEGIRFVRGDLRDRAAVAAAAAGCEVVFHQGAKRSVPRSIAEPEAFTEVNVLGSLNVLLAAREEGSRVVAASSSSVYGDQDAFPLVETMLPRPRSPYAASKVAMEAYCRAFWHSAGVPAVALRYFNVFGPGQDPASEYAAVVPRFVQACLSGTPPVVHGDGEQSRDFTFIDDAVEANLLAARAPEAAQGLAFNVAGGAPPTTINQVLALVAELTGTTPKPRFDPPRPGDVRRTEADVTLARELLGFAPAVSFREGLERTVAAFRRLRHGAGAGTPRT